MTELVDLRLHQHAIAHEIYRHQMMQRLPDPYPSMLPVPPPQSRQPIHIPPRYLTGIEIKLQNSDLWNEFHQIGTEMIITKSGRRMFPSLRLSLTGLEDDTNYCILLEMVPIGDCRYKFSGSQWVPAGGSEPQSPHRMYLHQDSPALGSHWQSQPILFNKVKLTNNTLDNNGHIVLTSMHKYQPRIHIIKTSDPSQIPWSPQSSYTFNETEFVAVTAYQNDRITKLKIDNNPFAKGFRETGQSRCKRKSVPNSCDANAKNKDGSVSKHDDTDEREVKRMRPNSSSSGCSVSSLDDSGLSISETSSNGTTSPPTNILSNDQDDMIRLREISHQQLANDSFMQNYNNFINPWMMDFAFQYLARPYSYYPSIPTLDLFNPATSAHYISTSAVSPTAVAPIIAPTTSASQSNNNYQNCIENRDKLIINNNNNQNHQPVKKSSFTISAILGCDR